MSRFIKYFSIEEAVICGLMLVLLIYLIWRIYHYIKKDDKAKPLKSIIGESIMFVFIAIIFALALHFQYNNCDLYETAVEYETYGNYIDAMEIYKQILPFADVEERIERIHDEYYYQLGHQYLYEKKYLGAAACFSQCVFYGESYKYLQIAMDAYLEEGGTLSKDLHISVE